MTGWILCFVILIPVFQISRYSISRFWKQPDFGYVLSVAGGSVSLFSREQRAIYAGLIVAGAFIAACSRHPGPLKSRLLPSLRWTGWAVLPQIMLLLPR